MTSSRSEGSIGTLLPLFDIVHTARLADRAFARAFTGCGLAAGHFGVLASVNDVPGITQAQVARRLHAQPQTVARPVGQLLGRRLIRAGTPTGQGGATPLFITPLGIAALDEAWPAVAELNDPNTLGLTADEAVTLARLLETTRRHLLPRVTGDSLDQE